MNTRAQRLFASTDWLALRPWWSGSAFTHAKCSREGRVGLSPYDRVQRPGCNFYTALPRCGSILCHRSVTYLFRRDLLPSS
jgi:hypothetical protein